MNTFKKIAAVAMAAATLATTMLTAGAYYKNTLYLGNLTATNKYTNAPTINYSLLDDWNENNIIFDEVGRGIGMDCCVLSVDFRTRGSDKMIDDVYNEMAYRLENLYMLDENGKYITEGRYPLVVDTWTLGDDGRANIIAESNDIFAGSRLDISNVRFCLGKNYDGRKDHDVLQFEYKIKGAAVLPSYTFSVGGTACETRFDRNYIYDLGTGKLVTRCKATVFVPHSYIANGESTQTLSINGTKIADITLSPTRSCPVYKNY